MQAKTGARFALLAAALFGAGCQQAFTGSGAGITVSVAPRNISVLALTTTMFVATVAGLATGESTAVTWSITEAGGGSANASGLYTAPANAGTFHVVATSVADHTKTDVA